MKNSDRILEMKVEAFVDEEADKTKTYFIDAALQ
jgi:hypothetical protein